MPSLLNLAILTLWISCIEVVADQEPIVPSKKQPNIIFILTDDQDLHMDSLSYMPHLKNHITNRGTTFTRHYCTVAQCCPSRVNLWTGRAAHNTNVTDVNPPYGGWPKFVSQGFNAAYLPLWLQFSNYNTYYIGKLFNAHNITNYNSPYAAGWTGSEFLLNPYTYEYLNATLVRNHESPVSYEGQYSTDVLASKAFGFLDEALVSYRTEGKPFFMTIAPTAPHSNVHMNTFIDGNFNEGSNTQSPPVPAPRHAHLFSEIKVPRTPNFNPSNPHGVSWISQLPQQNQTNLDFNDHFYRSRLRALQAVDEMIDDLFAHLTPEVLQNTYIFFSTDNGYHIGQHRLQPGKQCAFEEDVNIPFIVRGPGIPQNHSTDIVTTHTDLAPTFLALAGATLRADFDGQVIPLHGLTTTPQHDRSPSSSFRSSPIGHSLSAPSSHWSPEHINIEQWGVIMSEGNHGSILYPNHTYKALRLISPTNGYNLLYTVWCSGEHELYNLLADPYETENLYPRTNHTGATISLHPPPARHDPYRSDTLPPAHDLAHHDAVLSSVSLDRLLPRLDALLMVLKTCKARQCTHPWEVLHPHDTVRDLEQAMDARYDEFYAAQAKVAFDRCEKAYIPESEGAMWVGFDNAT